MQGVGRGRSEIQVFASLLTNPGFNGSEETRILLPTKINSNHRLWKEQGCYSGKEFLASGDPVKEQTPAFSIRECL
jgi:hypothetical protein